MRILLVGHGRAGKDEAGNYLESITDLKFAGTTSFYLTKYVAERMGVSEEEAYNSRHKNRMIWRQIGDEIRQSNPLLLVEEAFNNGDITGGVRGLPEIVAAREVVDLIVWIDNQNVPVDPTVEFTEEQADVVIPNHWSLTTYHYRLERLAAALGILKADEVHWTRLLGA